MPAVAQVQEWSEVIPHVIPLRGGLDQLTPTLSLKPGYLRDSCNFECSVNGGYTRVAGYERFDGRARPSDASYSIVQVVTFTNTPAVGQTLTGNTTGTTGQIIAVGSNYMALTLIVGAGFSSSEVVKVGATTIGTATPQTVTISSKLRAQYLNLAADVYRALIGVVPGSGPIRGVFSAVFSGTRKVYAFRDNVGATACVLHEATAGGWTPVTLFSEVSFTGGNGAIPAEGATLTQGANSATLKRVVTQSGSWSGGTAAGRFIITAPAPGNFGAGALTAGATATLSGAQTAISFAVGGKFEFDLANFAGQLSSRRVYGADGVNRGFEFDGTVLVPISTGAATDTPKHVKEHHKHLVLSIGSSLMISGPGLPYRFSSTDGGAEVAVGDTVTNLLVQPGNQDSAALAVFSRNLSHTLYGTSAADWKLVSFASATGAYDYMARNLDRSYLLDDRGVLSFQTAQEYGNFLQATLTQNLHTFISEKRSLSVYACTNNDKSQFRLFFSDGSGLYVTLVNGKLLGCTPVLFSHPVNVAWNGENAAGDEETYFGAASGGFVYQLDKGSSFDGDNIDAYLTLAWDFIKSPRIRKRYRKASFEVQGLFYAAFSFGYRLGYGSSDIAQPASVEYETALQGEASWDQVNWDDFVWDGFTLAPTEAEMKGTAENFQLTLRSTTDYIFPFTINSYIVHYSNRRRMR